jgi:hypothetical protein
VLHTWTQDLRRHLHVHALMACGALKQDGGDGEAHWQTPTRGPTFLFPVHALSCVFRGKFLAALEQAVDQKRLPRDPASTRAEQARRVQLLRRHDWVVYAKTPMAGPAAALDYLSRYTHRTAIGNERLQGQDASCVRLRVRVNKKDGKPQGKRSVAIDGVQFVGRLLQHVLPPGFKRIRHYGLLSPALKAEQLAQARRLLEMPAANPQAKEDAEVFMRRVAALEIGRCQHCGLGQWRVLCEAAPVRLAWPLPGVATASNCRGPP